MTFGRQLHQGWTPTDITEEEKVLIQLLQEDLPLVSRPFDELAKKVGLTGADLTLRIKKMRQEGKIRKVGAILRHQKAGYGENAMFCWEVPEDKVEEAGKTFSKFSFVTHCYVRPTMPNFPYNVYAMTHAKSPEELKEFGRQMQEGSGFTSFHALISEKEYKKSSPVFFGGAADFYPHIALELDVG